LRPPPAFIPPPGTTLAAADIDRWNDEDWLRDSVVDAIEDSVELEMAEFFISDKLFLSSPRVLFTSGLLREVRLFPDRPLCFRFMLLLKGIVVYVGVELRLVGDEFLV
jgi:hypothetical protein